jgi:general stress protein 26
VHGASVYYTYTGGFIYVLTKELTNKARNILVHSQIALTVTDEQALKTLELEGLAEVETDLLARQQVFNKITKERVYQDGRKLPPITNLEAGSFVVIRIAPKLAELNDYHHKIFRI